MAKSENVVIVPMTKKQKALNALKIFGICFGTVVGIIAAVVLYVWISGGFNPPYVPLTEMHFSQNEYVISDLDNISLVPNDGCTELDNVVITIQDTSIVALVEDDNTKAVVDNTEETPQPQAEEEQPEPTVANKYTSVIGKNIQIIPIKQTINAGTEYEKEINVGGWVKLVAERGLIQTECWVYVDVLVESLDLKVNTNLEKVEPEEGEEEPLETYIVYPNSTISLGVKNQQPAKAFNLPSTTLSTHTGGKTETSFNNLKNIYYVVSDDTLASVDSTTGIVTIKENVEGSFTVYAYVVADYNNIGKEPKLEDFVNEFGESEGFINWEEEFDKIRVKTKKIQFNIKDIVVENLTVAKEKLTYNLLSNNNIIQVNYVNTTSNKIDELHNNIYHYAIDLNLSYESASKGILFENVVLKSGYIVTDAQTPNAIFLNNNYVVLDDTYIKISQPTINYDATPRQLAWNLVVNEYKASGNVLVFGYPIYDQEGAVTDYIYDYVEIEINKVAIESLSFNKVEKEINLAYNDAEGNAETRDLANSVSVNPSNATYGRFIQYFAPEGDDIIQVDNSFKIKTIDNKVYYAICKGDGDERVYNIINPIKDSGKTSVVAVVLIHDANGELIQEDGYFKFDYIGNLSDSITVNVLKNLKIESVDIKDANGVNSILNRDTKSVKISKGDTFVVEIVCDDNVVDDAVFTWAIEGDSNQDMLKQTNNVSIDGKKLTYTLTATRDGALTLYFADKTGNKITYIPNLVNILVEIDNTELQGITLSSNAQNGVSVKLNTNGTPDDLGNLVANGYEWKILDENGNLTNEDLTFNITYEPANTNNKTIAIAGYQLPENFTDLDSLTIESLKLSDVLTFEDNYDDGASILPVINKPGKVIIFATSLSGEIISNPILVEITIPEIVVEFQDDINSQEITAIDGVSKSLTNYNSLVDGKEGNKFSIGVYTKTKDTVINTKKSYYTLEQDKYVKVETLDESFIDSYYEFTDISGLVNYKFAGEYTVDEDGLLVSSSGVKIHNTDKTLILCDIDSNLQEIVLMWTEFGYQSAPDQSFIYNLVADYVVTIISGEYFAPSVIDIFGNYQEVINPVNSDIQNYYELNDEVYSLTTDSAIIQGKTYYQLIEPAVKFTNKAGNILYLPENYNINNLSEDYKAQFEQIVNNLSLSILGTYCSIDYSTGKVKIYRIPTDETKVSVVISVLKSDNKMGYSEQFLFTVKPAVSSNFEANGYDDNSNQVLVVDTTVIENDGLLTFQNGNIVNLTEKLNYNILNNSEVEIDNVEFSTGYISMVGVDALEGNKIVRYQLTADAEINYQKAYYIQKVAGYELAKLPSPQNLNYFELIEGGYEKSVDSQIDYSKVYYEQTASGFSVVELPTPLTLGYYEQTKIYAEITEIDNNGKTNYQLQLNDALLENDITDFQIKLQVEAKVSKDGLVTKITSYYIIKFELQLGN